MRAQDFSSFGNLGLSDMLWGVLVYKRGTGGRGQSGFFFLSWEHPVVEENLKILSSCGWLERRESEGHGGTQNRNLQNGIILRLIKA